MATSTQSPLTEHQHLNDVDNQKSIETKEELLNVTFNDIEHNESKFDDNNTNDPFAIDYNDKDPFDTNIKPIHMNNNLHFTQSPMDKQMTLYSTLEELNEPLPLPYKKNCISKMWYNMETFLAIHPRIYSLYLLYSSTWPRGLVLIDMWTDFAVVRSLYENQQIMWFMLSSIFLILPFVLVWTVSLRFIQKFINDLYSQKRNNSKCMRNLVNFGLMLYIFPPIGAVSVALYEVYLVLYDVINGVKCFILGTGFVETQTNDVRAMKQYRRAVEIFSESIPQTLLQLWMFVRKVEVSKQDLYRSLAISVFNLVINAYRFRKEAKLNGMSISEYALSVLQLAEIPIVRLVPRLPAIKQGKLDYINFAGFSFDKESITPIIEALNGVRCVLNTMKISIGSLINLDLESCRLMGRILKDARIRVFISRTFSLLHIKNLFEEIDEDHNGYLDEDEFSKALQSLNSGLLYMDEQQQKRIFQKLAIRRIKKRDRVYFYDFFRTAVSVRNKTIEFDITQMDFPLHYVFQYLTTLFREMKDNPSSEIQISVENVEKLYYFCCGLDCFDQIDKSINNHIFYTIVDALNAINTAKNNTMNAEITNIEEFVIKCFHEMLESDIITNDAKNLLETRNNLFQRDIDEKIYNKFIIDLYNNQTHEGLNIFEYCFAFNDVSKDKNGYLFVCLFDCYLKTRNKYLMQQNDEENQKILSDENGILLYLYNADKLKESGTLLLELAAEHGLFDVIEFFCKYLIKDYSAEGLYKVCHELLKNEDHQSPETFSLLLKYARDNGIELVNYAKDHNIEAMDDVISKTQSNIQRKKELDQTDEDKLIAVAADESILRYLEILSEFGFDFSVHSSLHIAIKAKQHDIMQHIIELCRKQSYDDIVKLLNESDNNGNSAVVMAYKKLDLISIETLLKCEEQNCNEVFSKINVDIKGHRNRHLWIKFMYDIIESDDFDVLNNMSFKYEIKKQIYDTLQHLLTRRQLENETMPISKTKTIVSEKGSVMKKILHFKDIFGTKKVDKQRATADDGGIDSKKRVSFKQMAIVICDKINENISEYKPETVIMDAVKEAGDDGYETKRTEEKKQQDEEDYSPSGMYALLGEDDDDSGVYEKCQAQIEHLKERIRSMYNDADNRILATVCEDMDDDRYSLRLRRQFPGHFGKIYSFDWSYDSTQIVSASQDGKLLLWNVSTGNKQVSIPLRSAWVMTSAFSRTSSDYVACGGLDNLVSVFLVSDEETGWNSKQPYRELQQHEGYISTIVFINDDELLSCSGDATAMLWDVEKAMPKQTFVDHDGDVECIDVNRDNPELFVSGSIDATIKVWDMRLPTKNSCIWTFKGHKSDVNCVKWFIDSNTIISGSDDATARLFDLKTYKQMNVYSDEDVYSSVTAVDRSSSGSYIFVGYDEDPFCLVWSSLKSQRMYSLEHPTRVSCLGVSPNGYALATGCWDKLLRIFA